VFDAVVQVCSNCSRAAVLAPHQSLQSSTPRLCIARSTGWADPQATKAEKAMFGEVCGHCMSQQQQQLLASYA
jgi:hypothetical protein